MQLPAPEIMIMITASIVQGWVSCCLADKPLRMMKSFGENKSPAAAESGAAIDPSSAASCSSSSSASTSSSSSKKSSKVGHVVRKSKRGSVAPSSGGDGAGGGGNRGELVLPEYLTAENERTGLRMKQRKEFKR